MKTCLIVEDSALIREIAARIVRDLGFDPREAARPDEAVALCRAERPTVVLLDWDLPTLGALDFLRGLGELGADARPPVVLCATENDLEQFKLAKAVGAAWHILKPFDAAAVAEIFAEIGLIAGDARAPMALARDRAAAS